MHQKHHTQEWQYHTTPSKHWRLVHCLLYSTSPSPCRSINTVTIAQTTPCGTYVHAYAAFYLIIKHKQTVYTFVDFIVKLLTCCRQCLTVLGPLCFLFLFFQSKLLLLLLLLRNSSHITYKQSQRRYCTVPPTRRDLLACCCAQQLTAESTVRICTYTVEQLGL